MRKEKENENEKRRERKPTRLDTKAFSTCRCYRPVLNDMSFSTGQAIPVGCPVLIGGCRLVQMAIFLTVAVGAIYGSSPVEGIQAGLN